MEKEGRISYLLVAVFLAAFFFLSVGIFVFSLYSGPEKIFFSPDENANYLSARLYAEKSELSFFEKYNLYAGDIIHPRSFQSDNGSVKPVSFLGLALFYGTIISVLGSGVLVYLTPFFAALGIIFFYLFIAELFGRRQALLSSFLLAVFPVYIYYSARGLFHNVLFTFFLLAGLYFLVSSGRRSGWIAYLSYSFAGLFSGAAAAVRTSELIWMLPAGFFLLIFNFKKIDLFKFVLFAVFFLLPFLPIFYWQTILFESPLRSGYAAANESLEAAVKESADILANPFSLAGGEARGKVKSIFSQFFHFGFNFRQSASYVYHYFARMFFWLFGGAALGLAMIFFRRELIKKHWRYLAVFSLVSFILVVYYGSWKINDNPDLKSFTIGNSYTRYWLPIYLGAMPLFSVFFLRVADFWKSALARKIVFFSGLSFVLVYSLYFVAYGSEEGLARYYEEKKQMLAEREKVLSLTEDNAVIVTQYHDKLFFPQRKVVFGLFDNDYFVRNYANLASYLPVYYYNFTLPEKDILYLKNRRLCAFNLDIKEVAAVPPAFTLYKIESRPCVLPGERSNDELRMKIEIRDQNSEIGN